MFEYISLIITVVITSVHYFETEVSTSYFLITWLLTTTTSCILFYRYNLYEYTVHYFETELYLVLELCHS